MFGTLMHEPERRPLMFVENTDISSALSRNRRDKPRISCELCRTRKVRCSGQTPSCDRCAAVGAKCRYLSREARRKKGSTGRKADPSPQDRAGGGGGVNAGEEEAEQSCGDDDGAWESAPERGHKDPQPAPATAAETDADAVMFETNAALDYRPDVSGDLLTSYYMNNDSTGAKDTTSGINCFGDGLMGSIFADSSELSTIFDEELRHNSSDFSLDSMPQSWGKGRCDKHISRRNPSMSPQDPPRQPDSQNSSSRQSTDSPCWSDMFCLKPLKHRKNSAKQEEVGRNHTRPNLGRTDAQGGEEGCRCLNSTACLVEELGTKSASSDPVTMDVLLGYFRESLASCAAILNCNKCTLASEINMLLAMAGRYMSFLCERVIQSYVGLQRCNNGRPPSDFIYSTRRTDQAMALGPGAKSEGVAYGESTVVDMWLSTYRIENGHERAEVLRCLVKVQISEFYKVLSKLKARSGGSSGPSGAALGGRRENAGGRGGSGSERGLPAYGNAVEHEGSFSGGIRGIETSVACEDKKMLQYGDCRDGTKMVTHRLHVAMQPADWNFEELFEVTKKRTDARKRRYLGNKQDERGYWTRRLEMLCQSHA